MSTYIQVGKPVMSEKIGKALLKALNLEGQPITSINIDLCAGSLAYVNITRLIKDGEVNDIVNCLKQYELIQSDKTPEITDVPGEIKLL